MKYLDILQEKLFLQQVNDIYIYIYIISKRKSEKDKKAVPWIKRL